MVEDENGNVVRETMKDTGACLRMGKEFARVPRSCWRAQLQERKLLCALLGSSLPGLLRGQQRWPALHRPMFPTAHNVPCISSASHQLCRAGPCPSADVLARYKTMHETLVYLSHLDHDDTEHQMLDKLRLQVRLVAQGFCGGFCRSIVVVRLAHSSRQARPACRAGGVRTSTPNGRFFDPFFD